MRFACESYQGSCDLFLVGLDVGGGGAGTPVGVVAGVGAGDGVSELAFDAGEGGVSKPVNADLLGVDPRQVLPQALP